MKFFRVALLTRLVTSDANGDLPWIAAAILTHHKKISMRSANCTPMNSTSMDSNNLRRRPHSSFFETAERVFLDCFHAWLLDACDLEFAVPVQPPTGGAIGSIRPVLNAAFDLAEMNPEIQGASSADAIGGRFLRGLLLLCRSCRLCRRNVRPSESDPSPNRQCCRSEGKRRRPLPPPARSSTGKCNTHRSDGKRENGSRNALGRKDRGLKDLANRCSFMFFPIRRASTRCSFVWRAVLGLRKVALQHSRVAQAIYRQLLDRDYRAWRSPPASHAKNGRWQSFMQSRFAY